MKTKRETIINQLEQITFEVTTISNLKVAVY